MIQLESNGFMVVNNYLCDYIDKNFSPNKRYRVEGPKIKRNIFNKNKLYPLEEPIIMYNAKVNNIMFGDKDIDINKWIANVLNYIQYLLYTEKCYMYNNADDNYLYGEALKNDTEFNLFYNHVEEHYKTVYKVKSSINFSKIPKIESYLVNDYLLDNDAINNEVFCNIEIKREFGKKTSNSYSWIYGSDLTIDNDSDNELLLVIAGAINRAIIKQFNEILLRVINSKVYITNDIGNDWRNICDLCIVEDI